MELKLYLDRAAREMFPKMEASALSIIIAGNPDPKLCLELGAAILFDKPLIVLVPAGRSVPANLKRCASVIIEGDMSSAETRAKLQSALDGILANDARARTPGKA